jgi:hypothetical protein
MTNILSYKGTLRFLSPQSEWFSSSKQRAKAGKDTEKRDPDTLLVEMYISAVNMEINVEIP